MRYVRATHPDTGQPFYGQVQGEEVLELARPPYESTEPTGARFALDGLALLAPCQPSKIVAGGANYRSHLDELQLPVPDAPVFFLKAPSTLVGSGANIHYPDQTRQLEFEAELAVVIGKPLSKASEQEARQAIFGYTIANDVTARDIQFRNQSLMHMPHAKSFDTFCPCGPWVETDIKDPAELEFRTTVNGERLQVSNTNDMIFSIPEMIRFFSHIMTLNPGDLVLTGTPTTAGGLSAGDTVAITFQGIGTLTNTVVRA